MAAINMCIRNFRISAGFHNQLMLKSLSNRGASRSLFSRSGSTDTAADAKPDEPKKAEETKAEAGPSEAESKLQQEIDTLTKKSQEIEDKYKRALAETENVRKRLTKQAEDAKIFGIQGFCKDLLDVADTLHKAVDSVSQEELQKSDHTQLKDLFQGLKLTEGELKQVFHRHGLFQINPAEGEEFDPNVHEALFVQPVKEGFNTNTIMTVTKTGYKLKDRTIRPALVGVYK